MIERKFVAKIEQHVGPRASLLYPTRLVSVIRVVPLVVDLDDIGPTDVRLLLVGVERSPDPTECLT